MELKVGMKRKFSFDERNYVIQEILDEPNIIMSWKWSPTICPHCKNKIERTTQHKFYRIEILSPEGIEEDKITNNDLLICGFTNDRKYMQIPRDEVTYTNTLRLSKKFNKFVIEEK